MQVNSTYHTRIFGEVQELPEPTRVDKDTFNAIRKAQAKVEEERKEYTPTHKQLEENPWLKNAAIGLNKVSDIIKDYERGIDGSGKFSLSKLTNDSIDIVNDKDQVTGTYGIFTKVEETTTHLPWDDENYTRQGTKETTGMSLRYTYTSYKSNSFKSADITFDLKNTDAEIDFNKLTDKLKADKEFEKNFLASMEDYMNNSDSSKLIKYVKQALELENADITIKEPSSSSIYGDKGQLSSVVNNSSHLHLLA
ncbi:hypothetical protein [Candidatus Marinarcus aquaticus]|uniref:Uncharacterized protein n=1 Tax=Candidatus Marinarcus aquaticus TaxID=2044504 RepID=A0A4Q0XPH6_9BACT|nr:hypothetical protein [Candidatus Marinarcus aquaticus]RXJ54105.1 hypothetical protein CRV04_12035 [Candidatus Marinarcus aquaticus]